MPRRPPNPNSVPNIKNRVRTRDGFRCTKCGRSNDDHKASTGRQLEVHRVIPGSVYADDTCVTLCQSCHGPEPKRPRGEGAVDYGSGEPQFKIHLSAGLHGRVVRTARRLGLTPPAFLRMLLRVSLPQYEDRVSRLKKDGE